MGHAHALLRTGCGRRHNGRMRGQVSIMLSNSDTTLQDVTVSLGIVRQKCRLYYIVLFDLLRDKKHFLFARYFSLLLPQHWCPGPVLVTCRAHCWKTSEQFAVTAFFCRRRSARVRPLPIPPLKNRFHNFSITLDDCGCAAAAAAAAAAGGGTWPTVPRNISVHPKSGPNSPSVSQSVSP